MIQKYYDGTSKIINSAIEIGKLLGIVDATYLRKLSPPFSEEKQLQSIHASLNLEGNILSVEQVLAIFEQQRVLGPENAIKEVQNTIEAYKKLTDFNPFAEVSYLEAHRILMQELTPEPGLYREEVAVPEQPDSIWTIEQLMKNLFSYLIENEDNFIIKSCVFHCEMEVIHPFDAGNGLLERLWQRVILLQENPVFEYLPLDLKIKNNQEAYYKALSQSDREGLCTKFIEFMLDIIKASLEELIQDQRRNLSDIERIQYFKAQNTMKEFTRKDYMSVFKTISTATATRDLRKGAALGVFSKSGNNRVAKYRINA